MGKIVTTKMSQKKQALIILGLIIITPIIGFFIAQPVLDAIEKNKFTKLDTNINEIYKEIKSVASSDEDWKYIKECSDEYNGWMTTGNYFCHATISMTKTATSIKQVIDLHNKYFSIIDKNKNFTEEVGLQKYPASFGEEFAVGAEEKHYIEKNTNIKCWYSIWLSQKDENRKYSDSGYGSKIVNDSGDVEIKLNCSGKARYYWYGPDERLKRFVSN